MDKEELIPGLQVKVYRRRWYILFLFSFLALFNCTVWNTFGPIVSTVKELYPSWEEYTIPLLTNWGPISFLVFLVPILYIAENSLRLSVVLSSGLVFFGAGIRCLFVAFPNMSDTSFLVLCHVGAILNGIPGIVVTSIPAAISAAWFPVHERVTATSISQMLNNLGTAVSFLLAEIIVPENVGLNDTYTNNNTCGSQENHHVTLTHSQKSELRTDFHYYLLAITAPAAVLFSLAIIYFPSAPPLPPSRSSTQIRLNFWAGIKNLIQSGPAWSIAIVWSIPQAIWNNWCALMVVSLTQVGEDGECLSEKWINMLGIVAVLVGTAVAILVGMATDRIKGYMKITIMVLLASGGVTFTLLTLITTQILPLPSIISLKACIYALLLLGNSMVVSTSPLCMEFAVEKLYPVPEGIVGGWLNIWYNIISVMFLLIFNIPNVGTYWLNFVLPLSCFIVLPLLFFMKEEYKRRNIDENVNNNEDSLEQGHDNPLAKEEVY